MACAILNTGGYMYKLAEIAIDASELAKNKQLDEAYINQLASRVKNNGDLPALRVRDEVCEYHRQKWNKDIDLLINEVESIKHDATNAKLKLEVEYQNARNNIHNTPKRRPEIGADVNIIPWDPRAIIEAALVTVFIIASVVFNAINVPKLLASSTLLFKENPHLAMFFIITVSIGIVGYKLAESKFDILYKYIPATTLWASRGVFGFSVMAIVSFLALAHISFEENFIFWNLVQLTGRKALSMSAAFSVFMTEICTTFILAKVLVEIVDTHRAPDVENPLYTELKKTIENYIDLESTETKMTILLEKFKELKQNGINTYIQRADAHLVQIASDPKRV